MHDKRLSLCGRANPNRVDYSNATTKDLVTLPNGKKGFEGPGRISFKNLQKLRMENMNENVERGEFKGPFGPGTKGLKTTKNMHLIPKELTEKGALKDSKVEPIKKATKIVKSAMVKRTPEDEIPRPKPSVQNGIEKEIKEIMKDENESNHIDVNALLSKIKKNKGE